MLRRSVNIKPGTFVGLCNNNSSRLFSSLRHKSSTSSSFEGNIASIFTAQGQQAINKKKQDRLEQYQKDLLSKQQDLDAKAAQKPDLAARLTLIYLTAQCGILNYWVYSRFDWCLCEPITYLLGTAVTWLALGYYIFTGSDFDWDTLRSRAMRNEQQQMYSQHLNLDLEKIEELKKEIGLLEEEIEGATSPVVNQKK